MPRKLREYPLGFAVVGHQLLHNNGAVRPATAQEQLLWDMVAESAPDIKIDEREERRKREARATNG